MTDKCCGGGDSENTEGSTRRDFIFLAAGAVGAVGAAATAIPLIDSMNPSADVLALSSVEVDIASVQPGQTIKVKWRGKPVFVKRRTKEELALVNSVALTELKDPQKDSERVTAGKEEWLVVIGVCTHLGCIPISNQGEYGGWFCPCHGSQYDASGRIRKGPAPENLHVPTYTFLSDTKIRIG